jgi:hypothetical protein
MEPYTPSPVHRFAQSSVLPAVMVCVAVVLLGIVSGYLLTRVFPAVRTQTIVPGESVAKGAIVGSTDLKTYKDSATGILREGGKNGEGQFHLERPGGESQSVYLTSSLVDLSEFIGRKVTVNGLTQGSQKVGWLMDVGRVEVIE